MLFALIVATVSVVLGTILGLTRAWDRRVLGPVRTFALMASLGAIVLHLIPEAFETEPGWAAACFFGGLAGPPLLTRLLRWLRPQLGDAGASRVGLAATFVGLLAHRFADGLAIGSFSGGLHGGHLHIDVVLALSAHGIPVVAIFVLSLLEVHSVRSALFHAAGLAIVSALGVLLGPELVSAASARGSALVAAAVAGLLLHVVAGNLGADPPRKTRERAADFVAAALGLMVSLFGSDAHHGVDNAPPLDHASFASPLWRLTLDTAPLLLLGLAAGAALQASGSKIPSRWLVRRSTLADAWRGALVGAPLPLCSCSVLPVSEALRQRQAGAAFVAAFLLATPELGIETFALSVQFLGWPLAWLRLAGALFVAFAVGIVIAVFARQQPGSNEPQAEISFAKPNQPWHKSFFFAFDDLLYHVGAWMVLGLIAAAFLDGVLAPNALVGAKPLLLELALVSLISLPSYICASSAIPLVAVLIGKGLSPGAGLVALFLGPATNAATLVFLRNAYGWRATGAGLVGVLLGSWLLAIVANTYPLFAVDHPVAPQSNSDVQPTALLAVLMLALLVLRNIWLFGARHWLAGLLRHATHGGTHSHRHHDHAHHHGHGHG